MIVHKMKHTEMRFWPSLVVVVTAILVWALLVPTQLVLAGDQVFVVPAGQRQLFLDDHGIAKIENLKRTMHSPDKKGAVIRPDPQMGEDFIQSRTAPIWDPQVKIWKFWDMLGPRGARGNGYYESKDGLHWYKPVVGQVAYRNSTDNNYIAVPNKKYGPKQVQTVVYDATAEPARRFKSFLPNIGFAVSPDGIRWEMLSGVPAIASGDNFSLSFEEQSHLFLASIKLNGPYGRAVGLATSNDFVNWKNHGLIFHADALDQELGLKKIKARFADPTLEHPSYNIPDTYNVDVYMMSIFAYEGLFIGMPAMYHQTGKVPGNWPGFDDLPISPYMMKLYRQDGDWSGFFDIQLTCSRDLKDWKRLGDRKPFIGPSRVNSGAYDLGNIHSPASPVVRGDELWFYYSGGRYYGVVLDTPEGRLAGAICLAVLRRDGFISLDAGETEGVLLTKPFVVNGDKLFVNVDAPKGELRVDILDSQDGTSLANSLPLKGDLPRREVTWQKGDVAALQGKTVQLRMALKNASLYSYWLAE